MARGKLIDITGLRVGWLTVISYVRRRLELGWAIARALTEPVRKSKAG
jgi:hypothetical protein